MPVRALVIAGPTASGKTSVSIELAHRFGGEVISADSMQIYKYMDIGTAKPSMEERDGIPHYMLDIIDPWEDYSVAAYADAARKCIKDTAARGKLPIVVGGTGLYINALVENIQYGAAPDIPDSLVSELEAFAGKNGAEALHDILKKEDPEAAEQIHFNNVKRVIRAVGMKRVSGMTLSERNAASKSMPREIECNVYAIDTDREVLYSRINQRVDAMIEAGLEREVRDVIKLCENAYTESAARPRPNTALQAIGYKEFIDYFNGECDFESAVDRIKQYSRNYAKRQMTWFRKPDWVKWIRLEELKCIQNPEG